MGWRADVYKNRNFPKLLLYRDDALAEGTIDPEDGLTTGRAGKRILFILRLLFRYRYFVVYGDAEFFPVYRRTASFLSRFILAHVPSPELMILKLLRKKILFFPNGCHQEVLKRDFVKHEGGRVCANCIMPETVCNDRENQRIFDLVNRFHDFVIANTPMPSRSLPQKRQIKFLSLDLDAFRPDLEVPAAMRLPSNGRIRILHSFVDEGRAVPGKNVKGSPFILDAINRLKREGFSVDYFYLNKVPSRLMRMHQVQADIVVEQLIYGWWGSTAIECMGLGKPVVCYINASLKQEFLKVFPEYDGLPIIEANTDSIYATLKELVESPELRARKGRESRQFAERHFDVKKNAPAFAELLLSL
jgi:glycosyltransferase involved in cell wall biosynthesis